jgi:3-isopropylmalate/(R)-2-methylmalate dehydratase small subunit
MTALLEGRAVCFGAHVTTDEILPGRYLDRGADEVAQYAMAGADPGFAARVRPGDIIVAGADFGAGSGRESAPVALKGAGIAAVVAPGFGRLFFRNCINLGLPAVIVDDVAGIVDGDALTIDIGARTVFHAPSGTTRPIRNLTGISREVLEASGIVSFTKRRLLRP